MITMQSRFNKRGAEDVEVTYVTHGDALRHIIGIVFTTDDNSRMRLKMDIHTAKAIGEQLTCMADTYIAAEANGYISIKDI